MNRFDWDEEKRLLNLKKHGLDFLDAGLVFEGPIFVSQDIRFNYGEDRYIGYGILQNLVVVVA